MPRALWRTPPAGAVGTESTPGVARARGFRGLLDAHHAEVWRVARRLGVPDAAAEDVAQQVFLVAAGKLAVIVPGKERAFLIGITVRIAANHRRALAARRERPDDDMDARAGDGPRADELIDEKRLRLLLDRVLDSLPGDLRTVFVLFELEELGLDEIAQVLGIPRGTAASRLRRARDGFEHAAKGARARRAFAEEK
jgi:RNA polymerase sigma-70 factor (ECF subfamily)